MLDGFLFDAMSFAQISLGYMYMSGQGVPKDNLRAHMWLNLARNSKGLANLAPLMPPAQITQAQELALKCQASNYKQCE